MYETGLYVQMVRRELENLSCLCKKGQAYFLAFQFVMGRVFVLGIIVWGQELIEEIIYIPQAIVSSEWNEPPSDFWR